MTSIRGCILKDRFTLALMPILATLLSAAPAWSQVQIGIVSTAGAAFTGEVPTIVSDSRFHPVPLALGVQLQLTPVDRFGIGVEAQFRDVGSDFGELQVIAFGRLGLSHEPQSFFLKGGGTVLFWEDRFHIDSGAWGLIGGVGMDFGVRSRNVVGIELLGHALLDSSGYGSGMLTVGARYSFGLN